MTAPIVAPYVGAWIETDQAKCNREFRKSHPMWVRGLKLTLSIMMVEFLLSHPMWVRGLKPA